MEANKQFCRCVGSGAIICEACLGTGVIPDPRRSNEDLIHRIQCAHCHGSGRHNCPVCTGSGRIGDFEFKVEGTNAKEVLAVIRTLIRKGLERMKSTPKTEIHLHSSTVGILNAGEIENVQSISVNVTNLVNSGHKEIAKALKELTEAVANNEELSSTERVYVLENIEELSRQAALAPEERSKVGVIKAVWLGVASSIGAAGGLAEVWATWGNTIRAFFGF